MAKDVDPDVLIDQAKRRQKLIDEERIRPPKVDDLNTFAGDWEDNPEVGTTFNSGTPKESAPNVIPKSPNTSLGDYLSSGFGKAESLASGLNNSETSKSSNSVQSVALPADLQKAQDENTKLNPGEVSAAKEGLTEAAQNTADTVEPFVNNSLRSTYNLGDEALKNYQYHVDKNRDANTLAQSALIDAQSRLKDSDKYAVIKPNDYIDSLGISGKIMTGIGMVLSGFGSGLTGQPNMAYDYLNKQIDRNIQAQQKTYDDKIKQIAEDKGISLSYQEQATAHALAGNLAGVQVTHATDQLINQATAKANNKNAPQLAKPAILGISQQNQQYNNQTSAIMKTIYNMGNEKFTKLLIDLFNGIVGGDSGKPTTNIPGISAPLDKTTNIPQGSSGSYSASQGVDKKLNDLKRAVNKESEDNPQLDTAPDLDSVKSILKKNNVRPIGEIMKGAKYPTEKDLQ